MKVSDPTGSMLVAEEGSGVRALRFCSIVCFICYSSINMGKLLQLI